MLWKASCLCLFSYLALVLTARDATSEVPLRSGETSDATRSNAESGIRQPQKQPRPQPQSLDHLAVAKATCGDADGDRPGTDSASCPDGYVARLGVASTECHGATCDTSTPSSADTTACCKVRARWTTILSLLLPGFLVVVVLFWVGRNFSNTTFTIKSLIDYRPDHTAGFQVMLKLLVDGSQIRKREIGMPILLCVCTYIFFTCLVLCSFREGHDKDEHVIGYLLYLSMYINGFLPFFFAFYVNTLFTRWWTMRTSGIGAVYLACEKLCMSMASHCPGDDFERQHNSMLRYTKLVHALIFMAAREEDELDELVKTDVLVESEKVALMEAAAEGFDRPKLAWKWVMDLWVALYKEKHIEWWVLERVHVVIDDGLDGVQCISTHLSTKIPYAWLHLMAFLVSVSAIIIILKASIVTADVMIDDKYYGKLNCRVSIETGLQCNAEVLCACISVFSQILQVILFPLVYLGFLSLTSSIMNPFGREACDFPDEDYLKGIEDLTSGFFTLSRSSPESK